MTRRISAVAVCCSSDSVTWAWACVRASFFCCSSVNNRTFSLAEFDSLLAAFSRGATMHVSSTQASGEYVKQALQIPGMKGAVAKLGASGNPAAVAAAVEFVLEGLHLNRKLNKERGDTRSTFRA